MSTRRAQYWNDVLIESERDGPAHAHAIEHRYRSIIALPLVVDEDVRGCLALFAREPNFVTEGELRLLDELASDVSFALRFIDRNDALTYLAHHDALTDLPNRTAFLERLKGLIDTAARTSGTLAVLVGNLRRFRYVNESLGREFGDALLRELAGRLRAIWPDPQLVARAGGDSFLGVLVDAGDPARVAHLIESRLRGPYAEPFTLQGHQIGIGFNIGIALFPTDGQDPETLIQGAESALNASRTTNDPFRFYQPDLSERIGRLLQLEGRLRNALEHNQFELHYQPKVEVHTRRVCGFEALLRWADPEHGLVSPGEFIPVLEESGLIVDVGAWVIRRALEDERRWLERGLRPARIAVNVSARQLRERHFLDFVKQTLRAYGGGGRGLDIEITESGFMEDIEGAIAQMRSLREMGVGIAIDDFGTGYSSLAYLARLPVSFLKIDRSFIATMNDSPESMSIVSTTISLAHSLDLKVIAEGVETEEQAKLLHLLRCDQIQGYLVSRPRPADALDEFLMSTATAS